MVYMGTTTIRVPTETRDRLNALARRTGATAADVVSALVRDADERTLLDDAQAAWARLGDDPASLAAYRAESAELEAFAPPLPAEPSGPAG
jgi:hypothetical protein